MRIDFIDILKSLGVLLVVIGHIPFTCMPLLTVVFSFHMPLFFICSGYLYKDSPLDKAFFKKNIYQLVVVMIPYFLINRVFNIVQDALYYPDRLTIENEFLSPFCSFLLGESSIGWMWFLWTLFWMRLLYCIVCRYVSNPYLLLAISVFSGIIWYHSGCRFNLYQLSAFLFCMPFFCLGRMLKRWEHDICTMKGWRLIFTISALTVTYIKLLQNVGKVDMNALEMGHAGYLCYLLIGSVAYLWLMLVLSHVHFSKDVMCRLRIISNGSLVYLGLHGIIIQVSKIAYKKINHINLPPPIHRYCIRTCYCIFDCYCIIFPNKTNFKFQE